MLTITKAALLTALVLALGVAGCGGDDDQGGGSGAAPTATPSKPAGDGDSEAEREAEASGKEKRCDEVGDISGKPKRRFPKTLALPSGARVYESEGPFGRTVRYFAVTSGEPGELPAVRDRAAAALKAKGYKLLDSDQEEGAEAEAHLSRAKGTVDVQVINLCEGKLRIRYTVS